MSKQKLAQPRYMVGIYDDPNRTGALMFSFVPNGAETGPPLQYTVSVQGHGDTMAFQWLKSAPNDAVRGELEEIARDRVTARHVWIERLNKLIATVKEWAESQGWSTKIVEKKMEDAEVGNYKAPGLVLQDPPVRLYLEPITRSAPGSQGVVDLYLMPSYDDVASLYFYKRRWNLHYLFKGVQSVAPVREAEAQSLTQGSLLKVLDEMKQNAG